MEKSEIDLRSQIQSAEVLLRRLIPENIAIRIDAPSEPVWIEGDPGQIQQVLLNLAINGRDAMPLGGTLTLRTGFLRHEMFLDVEDTGHGMDQAAREQIFEPFFTTRDLGKGTGLGLAVVHGIVEQHSARIEVQSRPGEGSRFRLIFPKSARMSASRIEATPEDESARGRRTILLVEDEPVVREAIAMLLEMIGYAVISAGSGEEALALPLEPVPDLLLSDVKLPGMPGSVAAVQLVARWPLLKVVLMSGYFDDEGLLGMVAERGWDFLQKPFEMTDLADELEASLHGNRVVAETIS